MNCFEARNGFTGFWRRTLEPRTRASLLAHLKECGRCDRAFRVFATTGALLYSECAVAEPHTQPRHRDPYRAVDSSRRHESIRAAAGLRRARRAWRAVCAVMVMTAAAAFAAYLATTTPRQTLDDALSNPEPISDVTGQDDLPASPLNDLAS
jgi:hypothetical protein